MRSSPIPALLAALAVGVLGFGVGLLVDFDDPEAEQSAVRAEGMVDRDSMIESEPAGAGSGPDDGGNDPDDEGAAAPTTTASASAGGGAATDPNLGDDDAPAEPSEAEPPADPDSGSGDDPAAGAGDGTVVFTPGPGGLGGPVPAADEALAMAQVLSESIILPSDCGLPLDEPASLPNSDRSYRSGVHQGIDFICEETGRSVWAALPGRVVVARGGFTEPVPEDRSAVLGTAGAVGHTPPWTLAMLFGNFVVIDHGVVDGVGHVVSVYAHMAEVDPALRTASTVQTGALLGEIGNTGTNAAATNNGNLRSLHLHWEIYVDGVYLGAGLNETETRQLYALLFSSSLAGS